MKKYYLLGLLAWSSGYSADIFWSYDAAYTRQYYSVRADANYEWSDGTVDMWRDGYATISGYHYGNGGWYGGAQGSFIDTVSQNVTYSASWYGFDGDFGSGSLDIWVYPSNEAQYVSQSVPSSIDLGQTATATVTMRNNGSFTWTFAEYYRLGTQNPVNNSNLGIDRGFLDGDIASGQDKTFSLTLAPGSPGHKNFQWMMVKEGIEWFGEVTPNVVVVVNNVVPTNTLSVQSPVHIGTAINLTHTANNPTTLSNYLTGFAIYERRLDINGSVYQGWQQINYQAPEAGNRSFVTSRPAPDRSGTIEYNILSWNQWMSEGENTQVVSVQVINRPPVNTSMSAPDKIYGQTATFSASATDADGNLTYLHPLISGPSAASNGPWAGVNPIGQPWNHFASFGASGSNATASGNIVNNNGGLILPLAVGTYRLTLNSEDAIPTWTYNGGAVMASFTVSRATPVGTYTHQALSEGVLLTAAHLNATFSNPHNANLTVPGVISYQIVAGGVSPYTNGTALYVGQQLPAGTYTVRASIPASGNYEVGAIDVTFGVTYNGQADNDGDGITNATEIALGTNPNVAAQNSSTALEKKVHTPRP